MGSDCGVNADSSYRAGGSLSHHFGEGRADARSRRVSAGLVAALHVAVFLLVLIPTESTRLPRMTSLAAFNLPAASTHAKAVAKPKSVRPPTPLPDAPRLPLIEASVIAKPAADSLPQVTPLATNAEPAQNAPSQEELLNGGCDLTDPVQSALQANADVRALLPQIPRAQRSVANAIMIWSQNWVQPGASDAGPAFASIRQTVALTVLAASDQCRSQIQRGPRLMYLPGTNGETTVLALGSGQWTWQQVADTVQPEDGQPAGPSNIPNSPGPDRRLQPMQVRLTPSLVPVVNPPHNPARIVDAALASLPKARRHNRR